MGSLEDSSKILIITAKEPTLDQYAAKYSIITALDKLPGKELSIGTTGVSQSIYRKIFPLKDTKIVDKLQTKKFLIEFKNQKDPVKSIQWTQEGNLVKFFITMENGDFNTTPPDIRSGETDYDSIILIGINNIAQMGLIYSEFKDSFKSCKVISIGSQVKDPWINILHEYNDNNLSICEDVYSFLISNEIKIDTNIANALLAGIFFSTDNFKKNLNNSKTFITSSELMKLGATNKSAQSILDRIKLSKKDHLVPKSSKNKYFMPKNQDMSSQKPNISGTPSPNQQGNGGDMAVPDRILF